MNNNPEFFQPSSSGAWLVFAAVVVIAALIFPPLWGLYAGVGLFYAFFYAFYKGMGR